MIRIIHKGSVRASLVICFLFSVATAFAQPQEYKGCTIEKGDTLYSLPSVENTNIVYPGQTVKLAMRITQKEVVQPPRPRQELARAISQKPTPEVKPEPNRAETGVLIEPVEKEYLVDKGVLVSSGYISAALESRGKIVGSPSEHPLLGKGDYAYVTTLRPVKAGEKFYIVRSLEEVKDPETGAKLGNLIDVLGVAEVVGSESGKTKTKITASYDAIAAGDLLTDFYEIEQPFIVDAPRTPDIKGSVVATRKMHILNGTMDIVYINKGAKDGLEIGDILGTISKNQYSIPSGSIQVVKLANRTAVAIVRSSQRQIIAGDVFGQMEGKSGSPLASAESPVESVESAVNLFISQYVSAYESGDVDKFMSFYSKSAVENNGLHYDDIRRAYERNFRNSRYTYILKDIQMEKHKDYILLTGTYIIKKTEGRAAGSEAKGHITWELGREDGVLKIIRANYDRL